GTTRSTMLIALSTNTPVGSPFAPRSIRPPAGRFVAAVPPAARIAAALARIACPSILVRTTGLFGDTRERASCVGKRVSPHLFWSQPLPWIPRLLGDSGNLPL